MTQSAVRQKILFFSTLNIAKSLLAQCLTSEFELQLSDNNKGNSLFTRLLPIGFRFSIDC